MIKAVVFGYGNIGKYVTQTIKASSDFELTGVIRRNAQQVPAELLGVNIAHNLSELPQKPDVALICTPTRAVPDFAKMCLESGVNTVDSYDIHAGIWDLKVKLDPIAKLNNCVSIISAGWDPGSDSIVRAIMTAAAPEGITYTNFGPGMSMGHTVAAKAINGVKKALSMTIPLGTSIHRRMVYVELESGVVLEDISAKIKSDPYFSGDETHVIEVTSVDALLDMGHGVQMERKGVSGVTQNQRLSFSMSINNPALTAQIMVGAARAAIKQKPGAYTTIEVPVIDFLQGTSEELIRALV